MSLWQHFDTTERKDVCVFDEVLLHVILPAAVNVTCRALSVCWEGKVDHKDISKFLLCHQVGGQASAAQSSSGWRGSEQRDRRVWDEFQLPTGPGISGIFRGVIQTVRQAV